MSRLAQPELNELLRVAVRASDAAATVLRHGYAQPKGNEEHKGAVDLVTATDREAEKVVRTILDTSGIPVLGEEEGLQGDAPADVMWVVDPIDGTTNFANRLPHFATSIALWEIDRPAIGVVHDPMRGERFTTAGEGAWCNGSPLDALPPVDLSDALLATGFAYGQRSGTDMNLDRCDAFLRRARGLRRAGSAALDLTWVAAGRLDGYWESQLYPWDVLGGVALVHAVGGRVTRYDGRPVDLEHDTIVAAHPALHETMLATIDTVERAAGRR